MTTPRYTVRYVGDDVRPYTVVDGNEQRFIGRYGTFKQAQQIADALNATDPKPRFYVKDTFVYDRESLHGEGDYIMSCYNDGDNEDYTPESLATFIAEQLNASPKGEKIG